MEFTSAQKKIIEHINGYTLAIACPGSGKTTTVIGRTKNMIDKGISGNKILVITFTKNAADEMRNRYIALHGNAGISFSTIHSLCFTILRNEKGITRNDIYTETEKYRFFKDFFKGKVSIEDMEHFCERSISEISYIKNKEIPPFMWQTEIVIRNKPIDFLALYNAFEKDKKDKGKIDFDDMIIMVKELFQKDPFALTRWQETFDYITVDEFQDTNTIQNFIVEKLAEKHHNLCIVGDDDQSIYGFRAADSSIMLNFKTAHPDAKLFDLTTNYRSAKNIIKVAINLINHNEVRFPKEFKGKRTEKGVVNIIQCNDTQEEYTNLLRDIDSRRNAGVPYKDMAILYRVNKCAPAVIAKLTEFGVPFYTNEKIQNIHNNFVWQDIVAYYNLLKYKDDNYFPNCLAHPAKYLSKEITTGCPYNRAALISRIKNTVDYKKVKFFTMKVDDFFWELDMLKKNLDNPKRFVKLLLNNEYKTWAKDYCAFINRDPMVIMENIDALIEEAAQFSDFDSWINYVKDEKVKIENMSKDENGIRLMTFHGSKGLEFDSVFIIDANKGITPNERSTNEEEERRMFYVAITRAKNYLNVYSSSLFPSQYISEMGLEREEIKSEEKSEEKIKNKKQNTKKNKTAKQNITIKCDIPDEIARFCS